MTTIGKARITVICENSVGGISGSLGEHGFAALVEGDGFAILFDTGQGDTLLHNAFRMNRDLRQLSTVALSHGHHDHTGGLLNLLKNCGPKRVLAHPAIFSRRYRVKDTGESFPIGIPYQEEYLRGMGAAFSFSEGFQEIERGVFLTGQVPRTSSFQGDAGLFCDASGCMADTVPDDQSLVLRTGKGLLVIMGCCHSGVANTLRYGMEQTGVEEVYAVIGGTHLNFCTPEEVATTIQALRDYRVRRICPGHCTGFAASAKLLGEFPKGFHPLQVGYTMEI